VTGKLRVIQKIKIMAAVLDSAIDVVRNSAHELTGSREDFDPLMEMIGDSHFVLLGEASHGTHEFYRARCEITKRLIREKNFSAIAVEADWPDAYRVNRFVRGANEDAEAVDALGDFKRFPTWMWRNADVLDFVGWLRSHNDSLPKRSTKVGFYGLDLYSLNRSIHAVLEYLGKVDPQAAERARKRYSCFEDFGADPQAYGYAAASGTAEPCESEVVSQMIELNRHATEYAHRDGRIAADEFFFAEQNARLVKNAEEYYRSMFYGRVSSWNLRDQHMAQTLEALMSHLEKEEPQPKVVVWEHNSHLGDARATQMGERGELNVGQLVRQEHGRDAVLIGFTTYTGTVTAADDWDEPAKRKRVRPALEDSYEYLFHEAGIPRFVLSLQEQEVKESLRGPLLERAIGVIYRPDTERFSHYFDALLPKQFDAVIHFDVTRAVEPLERTARWERGDPPETFPTGF
jgi:erythromycin esterase-like protein